MSSSARPRPYNCWYRGCVELFQSVSRLTGEQRSNLVFSTVYQLQRHKLTTDKQLSFRRADQTIKSRTGRVRNQNLIFQQRCLLDIDKEWITVTGKETNQVLLRHHLHTISYSAVHPDARDFLIFIGKNAVNGTVKDRAIFLIESEHIHNINAALSKLFDRPQFPITTHLSDTSSSNNQTLPRRDSRPPHRRNSHLLPRIVESYTSESGNYTIPTLDNEGYAVYESARSSLSDSFLSSTPYESSYTGSVGDHELVDDQQFDYLPAARSNSKSIKSEFTQL